VPADFLLLIFVVIIPDTDVFAVQFFKQGYVFAGFHDIAVLCIQAIGIRLFHNLNFIPYGSHVGFSRLA